MSAKAGEEEPKEAPPPPPPPPPPAPTAEAPKPEPPPAAEPAKPPEVKPAGKVEQKGGSISLPGNIVFDTGKATLKPGSGSEVVLDQLKQFLVENDKKIAKIRIEGHTDNEGKRESNLELSGQRALTIKTWLVKNGIAAERLVAAGFGPDKPIAPNDKDEGRAQNRRTEFKIAETFDKKGKARPYLGLPVLGGGTEFK
jgi:outer membrane protein OmpA-like peptidoglycan-associated protein